MIVLKFKVEGQSLKRTDIKNIIAQTRNELYAEFELDSVWSEKEPVTAQFTGCGTTVDVFVGDGKCLVPWEVLQDRGTLSVCLMGGDLLTTNTVHISVLGTGVIGGLAPTVSSPGVYRYLVDLSKCIEFDWNSCKELLQEYKTDINIEKQELQNQIVIIDNNIKVVNDMLLGSETKLSDINSQYSEIIDLIANFKSDYADILAEFMTIKSDSITDINTARDNVLEKLSGVVTADNISDGAVTKQKLSDDIYVNYKNLLTPDGIVRTPYRNLGCTIAYNTGITLLKGHRYCIKVAAYNIANSYYDSKYFTILLNGNDIGNSGYNISAGNDYIANPSCTKYTINNTSVYYNLFDVLNDVEIERLFASQPCYIGSDTKFAVYLADITDLNDEAVQYIINNVPNDEQTYDLYRFVDSDYLKLLKRVDELESAIISLGGNV